jgi:putative ABC transport system permease protein
MAPLWRIWNAFRRTRLDSDLRQELDTHLALIEEEERAQGAGAEEARRNALSRFGSPLVHRERALDAAIATELESACRELVFAARRLMKSPAFSLTTVLTLSFAIGANIAIFAVLDGVVLEPLPYPDSDRIIVLDHGSQRLNFPSNLGLTQGLYYDYAERARTLNGIALYRVEDMTLTGDGEPERIRVARATPSLLSVLRVSPVRGRWFTEQEGVPGTRQLAVLSHAIWTRRYGGDAGIIGRPVMLGGSPAEVIGVMPASFAFPDEHVDAYTAVQIARATGFGLWSYQAVARLRDGATVADTRAELNGLIHDLPQAFPGDVGAAGSGDAIKLFSVATTLKEATIGNVARSLWILLASVGVVLLIACANVANLFLVRSEARQREVAVRLALGAGRLGIARYFSSESVLLSMAGGAIGLVLAWGAVRLLVGFGPASLPRLNEVRLNMVVLPFTLALSLLAALVFSAIPLWRGIPLARSLHESGRSITATRSRYRARHLLMAAQVALALVLLVSSGLLIRSFQKLRALDPGFNGDSALTFSLGLPDRNYPTRASAVAAHRALLERLSALPGVTAVSASTCLPLSNGCFGNTLLVEGRVYPTGTVPPVAVFRAVAGNYFEAMGIRVLRGRGIDRGDVERQEPVVVVNQALAERFFPNHDAIGERVATNHPPPRNGVAPQMTWLTIVGIVSNTPTRALAEANPWLQLYMPMSIAGGPDTPPLVGPSVLSMSYVLRATTPPLGLMAAVRRAIDAVDPKLAIAQVRTLEDILRGASAQMAFTMVLIAIAAAVALLLGLVGIFGVMSYIVTQRTGEIGVRLALGAEPRGVARMVVRQGGLVALAGIAIGLVAALAGSRVIESLLYGVSPRDPGVFVATTVLLLWVALVACWLPARRAARLSPVEALRTE